MAKAKVENFPVDVLDAIKGMYMGVRSESEARRKEVIEEAAALFNKKPRAIIAKLSREKTETGEKLYISKTPVAKDGKPAQRKSELAVDLARAAGVSLVGAENMNKEDMKKLIAAFASRDEEIARLGAEIDLAFGDMEDDRQEV